MVNFHMLSIEEKHSCWNQRDVKVTCVDWHSVDIHDVYISHTRNIMRRLGQLFCQGKITQYKIIHVRLNWQIKSTKVLEWPFDLFDCSESKEKKVDPIV